MNSGENATVASLPLLNVSAVFVSSKAVCVKDLYTGKMVPTIKAGVALPAALPAYDSGMFCAWPAAGDGAEQEGGACDGANNYP